MANLSWRVAFWLWTTIAYISTVATIVFLSIVTVAFNQQKEPAQGAAITAICLEVISLILVTILVWRESLSTINVDESRKVIVARRHRNGLISAVVASLGSAATLITIIWMGTVLGQLSTVLGIQPQALLAGLAITCVASILAFAGVFIMLFRSRHTFDSASTSMVTPEPATSPVVMAQRSNTSKSATSTVNPFISPPMTPTSISISSLRTSLTLPSRNNSTKTSIKSSRPTSRADPPPASAFDNWDTSSVAISIRDSIYSHARLTPPGRINTKLAPIPGSRPASPAKPLDGPFLPPSPHLNQVELSTSVSPSSPSSPTSPTSTIHRSQPASPTFPRYNSIRRPSIDRAQSSASAASLPRPQPPFAFQNSNSAPNTPSPSASVSSLPLGPHPALSRKYSTTSLADSVSHLQMKGGNGLAEENIHPLFRSCSPTPPPGASHGTVVVAASIGDALGMSSTEGFRSRATSFEGSRSRATSCAGQAGAANPLSSPLAMHTLWGELEGVQEGRASSIKGSVKGSIREEAEV